MPSRNTSEGQKVRGRRDVIKRIRGKTKQEHTRNTNLKTCHTSSKQKDRKRENISQKMEYRKERSTRFHCEYRSGRFTSSTSSTSSPIRSPWASPQKLRNRSPMCRSPKKFEQQTRTTSKTESSSASVNNEINHFGEEDDSVYVYEKIEGWDSDTDEEDVSTTNSKQ